MRCVSVGSRWVGGEGGEEGGRARQYPMAADTAWCRTRLQEQRKWHHVPALRPSKGYSVDFVFLCLFLASKHGA